MHHARSGDKLSPRIVYQGRMMTTAQNYEQAQAGTAISGKESLHYGGLDHGQHHPGFSLMSCFNHLLKHPLGLPSRLYLLVEAKGFPPGLIPHCVRHFLLGLVSLVALLESKEAVCCPARLVHKIR